MKTRIIASTLIMISVLSLACHKKAMKQSGDSAPKAEAKTAQEVKVDPAADMAATGSAYKLDSIALKGDVLSVFLNYSGGCKDHSFELVSNGMYAKSMPPQLSLCLKHTGNDDMCKKLVMQELKFDISKIKYKGSNSLTVKLGEQSAIYNY